MSVSAANPATSEERDAASRRAAAFVRLSKLPPFRPAALKLLNLSVESRSAMDEFERTFGSDPALTADLLLVANSAEFGPRSRIENIRHALAYLGLERVRSLGCTIAYSFFVRNVPRTEFTQSLWSHSIATAVIAEAAGALHGVPNLYTAGLMHDLGRLALLPCGGGEAADAMRGPFADIAEAFELERSQFGMTHCEAGEMLAESWDFPANLRVAMASHHEPASSRRNDSDSLVHGACLWAGTLGFPEFTLEGEPEVAALPARLDPGRLRAAIAQRIATFG